MSISKNILIIAGETSGDEHGASLVKQLSSEYNIYAMGADKLRDAGAEILVDSSELGVVGFIEIIRIIKKIRLAYKVVSRFIRSKKPDLVILIDYPGFNLRMAKISKKSGCKVLYYISPQLWAWREGRIKSIKRYIDQMAVILPFEVDYYQKHSVKAHYVGHPLTEDLSKIPDRLTARKQLGYEEPDLLIGLLPGSRKSEINFILPTLVASAKQLQLQHPNVKFLLPVAPHIEQNFIQNKLGDLNVTFSKDLYPTLAACDLLLATSGTVTLQAGLANTPMVVIYKSSKLSHAIAKLIVDVEFICLCNIIAGKEIVKELIQYQASTNNIVNEASNILDNPEYADQIRLQLRNMTQKLSYNPTQQSLPQLVTQLLD